MPSLQRGIPENKDKNEPAQLIFKPLSRDPSYCRDDVIEVARQDSSIKT
jgi:hypothetical protein